MKRILIAISLIFVCFGSSLSGQTLKSYSDRDEEWFGCEESVTVARNILILQKDNGGWSKNYKYYGVPMDEKTKEIHLSEKSGTKESTIDNSATTGEIEFLARMYQKLKTPEYLEAIKRGVDFLYSIQYPNGGFKQFSRDKGYYTHITYNDRAMERVLLLLEKIFRNEEPYTGLFTAKEKDRAEKSFKAGIECILNTQYKQNGKLTVWCAQHDENTLLPAKARAYELPSLSGAESVGLTKILMSIPNPDQRIIDAVNGAMAWFEANRITDHRVVNYINAEGKKDRKYVESTEGKDIWGRFCQLEDNKPFVCDRDGIIKYDISEIGYERRTGYGWYTDDPNDLFPRYAKWKKSIAR